MVQQRAGFLVSGNLERKFRSNIILFITIFIVPESTLQEVSGKREIGFQVPTFRGFHRFLLVATVEKPVETEMHKY